MAERRRVQRKDAAKQRTLRRQPTCDVAYFETELSKSSMRQVSADDIKSGRFLSTLAREYAESFQSLAASRPLAPQRKLKWASACSGSGADKLVLNAIREEYTRQGIQVSFETVFDCEINPGKQKC